MQARTLTQLHLSTPLPPPSSSSSTATATATALPTSHPLHNHLTNLPKTTIYTQLEDPKTIYLLHEDPTASPNILGINTATQDKITITHKSTQRIDLPAPTLPLAAPVLAIGRYFVRPGQRAEFQRAFEAGKGYLEAFTAPYPLVGGWAETPRVAGGADADTDDRSAAEYVLFSGWEAVERHFEFAETEGFKEFARIKEFMEGAEVKHAVRWEGRV
ncbi:hypothetical protein BO99DRAFT_475198 [Aspergillus violaceofuscus CBS 115571]|uniref:ABM domain-containing protein n=1 Tax=Aspergillus violaceofuscus (strain CBS 115571) TaxID=1450538 RepID=A0A2V5IBU6_ASPV1|nr:hypothetical protein BO99DRAFT_475198 [Aspergillus violaceofuscus CBS 115571]